MQTNNLFMTEDDFARVMALRPDPQLRKELERAIVVSRNSISSSIVTMYSQVSYRDERAGVCRQIQVVYPEDADVEQGRVSVLAPVGAALLGLALGQAIDWEFPDGQTRQLRVEEILYQPETWPREVGEAAPRSF
ncbi:MAG: nucleoside diphosphate kinase regulator [Betaproteobacteria bacterium]